MIWIEENESLGRYLMAARDINQGDVVINEAPVVKGPSQITGPVCLTCLQKITKSSSVECKRCGWPLCKNDACHETGTDHEAECNWTMEKRRQKVKISQFITPHRTYECVSVIRCLYLKENNPRVYKKLIELESHCEQRKGSEKYESDKMIVAKFLNQFFKISEDEFSQEEILRICGIIQINGHEVPLTDPPYVAIYEFTSMLEHSCVPNCSKTFLNDGSLLIRATRPIKRGEHISICYTDPLWSTINRKEHLMLTKFFNCECQRCADPTELGTHYSALKCLKKTCDGYMTPHITLNNNSLPDPQWKCASCAELQDKEKVNSVLIRVAHDYSMTDKKDTESCKMFLDHYTKYKIIHENHYFLFDVRLKLAQLYGQTTENDIQSVSDEDLRHKISLCEQILNFAKILFPAEWRIQGVLNFELHASVAESARRQMLSGEIDSETLRNKLLKSKRWLEDSIFYLRYEPDILPEGKMAKQAKKNLIDLESLLLKICLQL
ncbi:SET domain-containing protein SmydA-8-like isoform X2 [Planococcus citri]|uniref:SET domain-containing protein SmydA-8-like isoform X2 n=1 Tax=Planococcus citri TaxID=170843 RepID=UPI0031F974C2